MSSSTPSPSSINSKPLSLYTWGTNNHGSLLVPTSESILWEPTLVVPQENDSDNNNNNETAITSSIRQVVCGPTDTAILLDNGDAYVAGTNKSGQLGVGHTNPVPTLTRLSSSSSSSSSSSPLPPLATCSLGPTLAAYVTRDGDLYTCGWGGSLVAGVGGLGQGTADSYTTPTLVESLVQDGCYAQDVHVGESHMTVLTTEGEVLTTGASSYGRLGNGETSLDQLYLEPVEILERADAIAGGKSFTLALKDGVLYGWGRNHKGQLGTGFGMAVDMYSMEQVPNPIDADELLNRTVTKVAAGQNHAACITTSGELFVWGSSLHLEPVRVSEVLHTKIVDVACGNDYTLALSEDEQLYVWGRGKTGVLGMGSGTKNLHQAQLLKSVADKRVVSMSAGWSHAACLVVSDD